MKAAVNTRYGSPAVVAIRQVPKPVPKAGEVVVRVHATTVSRTDCGMLRAHPFFLRAVIGLRRPKHTILGMDFAGMVEAVGPGVSSFEPGQRVFGMSPDDFGAHAEYLCISEDAGIAPMPAGASFAEVLVCEGAWYASMYLKEFGLRSGHEILIYGASGAIGTAALQLAKFQGAKVTAVVATRHLDLVQSLGADRAVDFTAENFTQIGETFDFVFDAVGKTTFFRCRRLLKPGGVFAASDMGPYWQNPFLSLLPSIGGGRRVISPLRRSDKAECVRFLQARLEAGDFRAVIDRTYSLEAIVDAYRYVETQRKTGIVVINVAPAENGEPS
jgi:NADPH:quinone reductase-like Zn-dependent oxidoreductase